MPLFKVQLNHPGNEKPFKIGKGYQKVDGLIIREWNDDPRHYRKFIKNEGEYLTSLNGESQKGTLLFWGEWEGNSVFAPINNGKGSPNGIHAPFHSKLIRGLENTDPYIFGEYFKYVTCKQSGQVSLLDNFSLILFGSVYPTKNAFYLDTVFVVKSHETASEICYNGACNYSLTFREETLEQLENEYLGPNPSLSKKLYHGLAWWDNKEYFSFVPCRLQGNESFDRFKLDLNDPWYNLSSNPTGKSFMRNCKGSHQETWKRIAEMAIEQGFYLAIRLNEPSKNDEILSGFIINQSTSKRTCGKKVSSPPKAKGCN
jgi:hypothetical protein